MFDPEMTFAQKQQWLRERGFSIPLEDNVVSWIIAMIWNVISFLFTVFCIVVLIYTWFGGFASKKNQSTSDVPTIEWEDAEDEPYELDY